VPVAIVTGSGGLVGSATVEHFIDAGYRVVGVENDMRARFFGPEASTLDVSTDLGTRYSEEFEWVQLDIRDAEGLMRLFERHADELGAVIHTAAQPSHDWAASDVQTDFSVNANGTINLLEATRHTAPDAPFLFCSTNKVYGDGPNHLPLQEMDQRLELPDDHKYYAGIDTTMSIDGTLHSLFGVSKAAADLAVQEYGRYFDIPTLCLRGGCLTGPAHAGAQLHGFLAYLMKCTLTGEPYTVFGYEGKQVRDNMHAHDVALALLSFVKNPRCAAVYNFGGGRRSNCSMLEAIDASERIAGRRLDWTYSETARAGDHRWWISDLSAWEADYPDWRLRYDIDGILQEIHDANVERWVEVRA